MAVKSVFLEDNIIEDNDFRMKYYFELLPRRVKSVSN